MSIAPAVTMVGNPLDSGTPGSRFVVGDLFAGLDPLPAIRAPALPLADCLRNYNATHGDDIIAHRSRNLHNEENVLVGELLARTTMTYQLATSSSTTSRCDHQLPAFLRFSARMAHLGMMMAPPAWPVLDTELAIVMCFLLSLTR